MRVRDLFFTPRGQPKLLAPAVVALLVTFFAGWGAMRLVQRTLPDDERAQALARTGKFQAAEVIYVRRLREKPSVPLAIALLENHEHAAAMKRLHGRPGVPSSGVSGAPELDDDPRREEIRPRFAQHLRCRAQDSGRSAGAATAPAR